MTTKKMSEEISAGVRILLERAKSNPGELVEDYGKWGEMREAIYEYKENGKRSAWLRGLRPDEIDMLYEAFCKGARDLFDAYVMKNVLGVDEDAEERAHAQAVRSVISRHPQVFSPGAIYQNAIQPGAVMSLNTTHHPTTSIAKAFKNALGIK